MDFIILPEILAFIASCWTSDLIEFACAFLIAPFFGCQCGSFSIYGKNFYRSGGKWRTSKFKFRPINQNVLIKNLDDPEFERKYKGIKFYAFIPFLLKLAVTVFLFVISGRARERLFYVRADFFESFLASYAYIMIFITVITLIIVCTAVFGTSGLRRYTSEQLDLLRAGAPFSQLSLPPLSRLGLDSRLDSERILYNTVRGLYLIDKGDREELSSLIHELTNQLYPLSYVLVNTLGYYLLIFYYSRYELDANLAAHFFDKASSALASDMDANARRVLAYYAYGIQRDNAKARFFLEQAKAALPKHGGGHGAEYELEKRLIDELDGFLRNEGF